MRTESQTLSAGEPGAADGTRDSYKYLASLTTRWHDNDVYGHVNNVVYYSYFDTLVNQFLIRQGGLDIHEGPAIGLVVESMCRYHRALSFPDDVVGGLRIGKLGTSSVRYDIGLFAGGRLDAAAVGHFVHVFVDRATRRPCPIPTDIREALESLGLHKAP
jgi:acyl-CoA thioester hydrolase